MVGGLNGDEVSMMQTGFVLSGADGRKLRRILEADFLAWSRKSHTTYATRFPRCRFPLIDLELPESVSMRVREIVNARKWLACRKFFKDVSEAQWIAIREFVLARDACLCRYCRGEAVTADHVIAFANFGASHPDNLVAVCKVCNSSKGALDLLQWRQPR